LVGAFAAPASAAPAWLDLGGPVAPLPGSGGSYAQGPSLANLGGSPHLAWTEYTGSTTVRTGRYEGSPFDDAPWERLPGSPDSSTQTGGSSFPALAVVSGSLHVTWAEVDGQSQKIRVAKFDNGTETWGEMPAPSPNPINIDPTRNAFAPSIADIGGLPHVVWYEQPNACCASPTVHVKRWGGSSWVSVGSDPLGVGAGLNPDIANIGGVPHVAYEDTDNESSVGTVVTVKRFNGTSWVQVGSGANPISTYKGTPDFGLPDLGPTLSEVGGTTPYVAWTEPTGSSIFKQVRVKRFNGTSWEQPAAATSTLSRDPSQQSSQASIHTVGGSQPHVAWLEYDGANREVRVKRFDGSSWAELEGGASPINRNSDHNAQSVDMGSVGTVPVVAWEEILNGEDQDPKVYVSAFGDSPANTTRPAVSGTPKVGSSLSCSNGVWNGSPSQYTKTWERAPRATTADNDPAWSPINNATGDNYIVQAADAGSRVRCRVVASNAVLAGEAVSLSKRTDHDAPRPFGKPTVSGSQVAGATMTCDPGEWTNSPDLTYQWIQNGFPISGATQPTFSYPDSPSIDFNLLCRVTGTNELGSWTGDLSPPVHVVGSTPRRNVHPTLLLSGFYPNPVGARAECQGFHFTHDFGDYTYRWLREGVEIPGETGRTYTTTVDDLGRYLTCLVRGHNPKGPGDEMNSNGVLIALPPGTVGGQMARSGGRNEFDPVNFMALSDDFKAAVDPLVTERLQRAVDEERTRCAAGGAIPVPNASDFPDPLLPFGGTGRLGSTRCALLVLNPQAISVGPYGVQYTGPVKYRNGSSTVTRECLPPNCPDLGFKVQPVDPTNARTVLDADLLARIAPVIPERVLWDIDGDNRTDVECPGTAPVMRSMLDKGSWNPRAVIVAKDSAATGIYASVGGRVGDSFGHPESKDTKPARRRPAQAFVCRTSIEPPPDPKQSPCLTKGTIGRVEVSGNFCPVYLRALPPSQLKDLPTDVYNVLKAMADKMGVAKASRDAIYAPELGTSHVQASQFRGTDERRNSAAILNTMSGLTTTDPGLTSLGTQARLVPDALVSSIKNDIKKLVPTQANFAFDEIYWAKGAVNVNGTTIVPNDDKPTLLVPTDVSNAIESAGFNAMTINTPDAKTLMGDVELAVRGQINTRLDDARNKAVAVLRDKLDLDALEKELKDKAKLLLGPFKLAGTSADIKLENDGTATLTAMGKIDILKDPTSGDSLRVKLTLKGDKTGKLELQGVEFTAPGALLGPVRVSDLFFRYDGGLTVRGKILIPPHNEGVEIKSFKLNEQGGFKELDIAYLAGAGSGIPIGTGVYLTKLGGRFTLDPPLARFGLGATVSAGPSTGGGCPSVGLDSDADVTIGGVPTFLITITGQVQVVCIPLGNIAFRAGSDGLVTLNGAFNLDAGPFYVNGTIDGKIKAGLEKRLTLDAWQVGFGGEGGVRDFFIFGDVGIRAEGVVSNIGAAVCGEIDLPFVPKFGGGAAVNFANGRPPLTYPELIANFRLLKGCSLSKYKPLGKRNFLRGAQAGTTGFTVPQAEDGLLLSIEGAGDAPRVKLRSPSGKEYDFTGATNGVTLPDAYGEILEQEDRTIVLLGKPEPGQWTAEPAEGSPAVNRVEFSRILPKPAIKGSVSGKGSSKVLTYSIAKQEGQEVRFVEDAPEAAKTLGTVKGGGKGKLPFTVSEAKGTSRTIVAQVSQDGLPRANITITRFSAPNPAVGRPGKVRVKRSGSKAIVTWSAAALAANYTVSVTKSDGSRSVFFPEGKAKKLTIPGVGRSESVSVSVVATSQAGRKGPAGKGRLAKPKSKKKKKR
jgi:hypothetical protein